MKKWIRGSLVVGEGHIREDRQGRFRMCANNSISKAKRKKKHIFFKIIQIITISTYFKSPTRIAIAWSPSSGNSWKNVTTSRNQFKFFTITIYIVHAFIALQKPWPWDWKTVLRFPTHTTYLYPEEEKKERNISLSRVLTRAFYK